MLETIIEPDVFQIANELNENPESLAAALKRYPYTLLHGDYRGANLAYLEPDQVAVFDWHLSSRALMTLDLAFFSGGYFVRNAMGKAGAIRYYRDKLESYLGFSFDDDTWQVMLDLGNLIDAFFICFRAFFYMNAKEPEWKAFHKIQIEECVKSIRAGLRWL